MENLKNILAQKFDDKYSFLKVLEIVYNTVENNCTISFLYPENAAIAKPEKQEIADFLRAELALNAPVLVKFHKSYLDKNLIEDAALKFFQENHSSLASVIKRENICAAPQMFDVQITATLPEEILQKLNPDDLRAELIKFLSARFIANFEIAFLAGENLNHKEIAESIQKSLAESAKKIKPLARYKVFDVFKLVGKDITPEPEYLSNIRESKPSVILAGRIANFDKRTYKRMRNGKEVEKTYYKFSLYEENRFIPMVYFCPMANVTKMDKLVDGTEVLLIADIKKEHGNLNGYVRDLSLCQINPQVLAHNKEKQTNYITIRPEKYEILSQGNIFDVEVKYDANITGNTFVVFDVETTGLNPDDCEIIEIGAVKVAGGRVIEKFQTLVRPQAEISNLITGITGITNEMVESAPRIGQVIKDFHLFTQNTILAGYNVGFDMRFIQAAAREQNLKFENEVQDVMVLARQKVVSKNYKLSTIVKTLNLTLDNAHRAFFDALATAEVMLHLSKVE